MPDSPPVRYRLGTLLAAMCSALVLVIAAGSSLSLAIPDIARDTGAGQTQLTWVVNAYALVFAGLLLPCGILADRLGRRPVLLAGLAVFATATLTSGLLADPVALVALRAVAGAGAAAVMPATLSVLVDAFPVERRASAIGVWAAFSGAGAVLGLLLAGVLLQVAGWASVQLATGSLAVLVFLLCAAVVPASRNPTVPLDPIGSGLALLGLGGLVYGILEGPGHGWTDPVVLVALVAGAGFLAAFVMHELRTATPMLDVRLFRDPDLATGAAVVFLQFFAAFGVFFLVPQWLQYVHRLTPLQAALALVPMALGVAPTARSAPLLLKRLGARLLAAWGLGQMAVALALFAAQAGGAPLWMFEVTLVLFGTGFGLALAPGTQLVIESLPADRRSVAAAVTDVTRQVGGALGGAVAASALLGVYAPELGRLTAGLPHGMAAAAGSGVGQALGIAGHLGPRGDALAAGARHAFAEGFGTAVLACGGALLLGVAVCGLLVPGAARLFRFPAARRPAAPVEPAVPGAVPRQPSGRTRLVLVAAGTLGFCLAVSGVVQNLQQTAEAVTPAAFANGLTGTRTGPPPDVVAKASDPGAPDAAATTEAPESAATTSADTATAAPAPRKAAVVTRAAGTTSRAAAPTAATSSGTGKAATQTQAPGGSTAAGTTTATPTPTQTSDPTTDPTQTSDPTTDPTQTSDPTTDPTQTSDPTETTDTTDTTQTTDTTTADSTTP